jgi:ATP-dependent helicase IRC3
MTLKKFDEGLKRVAVSLPVGSGKTVIFTHLLKRWIPAQHQSKKVLILAHREELLSQPSRHLQRDSPHFNLGFEQGSKTPEIAKCHIILASVPTLARLNRLSKFNPKDFGLIIIGKSKFNKSR